MKYTATQTSPIQEDIEGNIAEHLKWIHRASNHNARLITFPEMSLTGYMRENAANFALTPDDIRLLPLKQLAQNKKMVIIAGAPIKIGRFLYIGSFIFMPNGETSIYTKQFLHPGEELFFKSSFNYNPVIPVENDKISLAICADIDHPVHAEAAANSGSSMYIPSIFFSQRGIPDAYTKLAAYSKQLSINILMSNFCGECWGTVSGGQTAFWSDRGELIASLNETDPGLLVIEKRNDSWHGEVIQ
jgi:predicted amidohydrolase